MPAVLSSSAPYADSAKVSLSLSHPIQISKMSLYVLIESASFVITET